MSEDSGFPGSARQPDSLERPNVGQWATPPRIGSDLAGQVRDAVVDVPWYVVSPLLRRRHLTWGATPAEAAAAMPGDDLLPGAQYRTTRAITVDAPPDRVWPWLVQVGYRRAGWYAGDLLDNFARSWSWRLVPLPGERTRLVTRLKTVYEWRRPLAPLTVVLMECADYPMMRRMLRGIRDRAEAQRSSPER